MPDCVVTGTCQNCVDRAALRWQGVVTLRWRVLARRACEMLFPAPRSARDEGYGCPLINKPTFGDAREVGCRRRASEKKMAVSLKGAMRGRLALGSAARAAVCGLSGIACLSLGIGGCARDTDPADLAIWRIVDHGCNAGPQVPAQSVSSNDLVCDTHDGYAILKDRCGPTHFLLIPTARRTGVESPELQTADEPNYFALAWEQRGRSLNAAPGDSDVGLAINSRYGRSQSQLHIHIDRLRPQVRAALQGLTLPLGPQTYLVLMGHRYRVDHLDSLASSPFAQAAREWDARTVEERARLTLAIASDGASGFFFLSDRADLTALDRGHAEELLLPRSCK